MKNLFFILAVAFFLFNLKATAQEVTYYPFTGRTIEDTTRIEKKVIEWHWHSITSKKTTPIVLESLTIIGGRNRPGIYTLLRVVQGTLTSSNLNDFLFTEKLMTVKISELNRVVNILKEKYPSILSADKVFIETLLSTQSLETIAPGIFLEKKQISGGSVLKLGQGENITIPSDINILVFKSTELSLRAPFVSKADELSLPELMQIFNKKDD